MKFYIIAILVLFALSHCGTKAKTAAPTVASSVTQSNLNVTSAFSASATMANPAASYNVGDYYSLKIVASGGSGNYKIGANPAIAGETLVSFGINQVGGTAQAYYVNTFKQAGTAPLSVLVYDGGVPTVVTTSSSFTVNAPGSNAVPPSPVPPSFSVVVSPGTIYLGNQVRVQIVPDATSGPVQHVYLDGNEIPLSGTSLVGTPTAVGTFSSTVLATGPGGNKSVTFQYNVLPPQAPQTLVVYRFSYAGPSGDLHWLPSHSTTEVGSPWVFDGPQFRLITSNIDAGAIALYRCYRPVNNDHYVSQHANCEGVPDARNEGVLGYALNTARNFSGLGAPQMLYRRLYPPTGTHYVTFDPTGAEGPLGYVYAP
jgi:hypothetical protein